MFNSYNSLEQSRRIQEQAKADARKRDGIDNESEMRSHEYSERYQKYYKDRSADSGWFSNGYIYFMVGIFLLLIFWNFDVFTQGLKDNPQLLENIKPYYEMVQDYFTD